MESVDQPPVVRTAHWPTELRALLYVAKQEMLVQSRYPTKFSLDLLGPLLGIAPIVLTAYVLSGGRHSEGLAAAANISDHFTFIMLGYIAYTALGFGNPVVFYTGVPWSLRFQQTAGVLERNLLAPIRRETLLGGVGLYYGALYLVHVGYLLAAGSLIFGFGLTVSPGNLLIAGAVLLSLFVMSLGMGLIASSIVLAVKDESTATLIVHRPFLILSGAYFLVDIMPQPFRLIAMANPVAYAVDAFRGTLSTSTILLPLPAELAIVFGSSVGIFVLGVWVLRLSLNRLMRTGEMTFF